MKNNKKLPGTATDKTNAKRGLTKHEEVAQNPDNRIDQDFPGFPNAPANEKAINPKTPEEKANANLIKKDDDAADENKHVGSANAFEATENDKVLREELNKNKKKNNKDAHY
jgi:hypothetical protein